MILRPLFAIETLRHLQVYSKFRQNTNDHEHTPNSTETATSQRSPALRGTMQCRVCAVCSAEFTCPASCRGTAPNCSGCRRATHAPALHMKPCACHCAACRAAGEGNTCVMVPLALDHLSDGCADAELPAAPPRRQHAAAAVHQDPPVLHGRSLLLRNVPLRTCERARRDSTRASRASSGPRARSGISRRSAASCGRCSRRNRNTFGQKNEYRVFKIC